MTSAKGGTENVSLLFNTESIRLTRYADWDDEEEASETANGNTQADRIWNFDSRIGAFFSLLTKPSASA